MSTVHDLRPPTSRAPIEAKAADREICDLIQRLVELVAPSSQCASDPAHFDAEKILIDRDVAGFRYLLVRMPDVAAEHAPLSPREMEIVELVARGHPTKVIAAILNISGWTVTTHLRRIFAKLGVASRPAMIARLAKSKGMDRTASDDNCLRSEGARYRAGVP